MRENKKKEKMLDKIEMKMLDKIEMKIKDKYNRYRLRIMRIKKKIEMKRKIIEMMNNDNNNHDYIFLVYYGNF